MGCVCYYFTYCICEELCISNFFTVLRPYEYIYIAAINLVTDVPVADVNEYLNSTVTDAKIAGSITQRIHSIIIKNIPKMQCMLLWIKLSCQYE